MKSIYFFILGIMITLFALAFFVDSYGHEFIQEYWIEQLWYGELNELYLTINRIIAIVTIILIVIGIYKLGQNAKADIKKEFDNN